jgi:hypothetical protein
MKISLNKLFPWPWTADDGREGERSMPLELLAESFGRGPPDTFFKMMNRISMHLTGNFIISLYSPLSNVELADRHHLA